MQSTAIQIAALKKLDKSMTLYIMDNNGSTARSGEQPAGHAAGAGLPAVQSPQRQVLRLPHGSSAAARVGTLGAHPHWFSEGSQAAPLSAASRPSGSKALECPLGSP